MSKSSRFTTAAHLFRAGTTGLRGRLRWRYRIVVEEEDIDDVGPIGGDEYAGSERDLQKIY